MRKLLISTGRNRFDKRWQQKEVSWEKLTDKLSRTHRTAETKAEYHIATADRKAEIKDIGGFVGGAVEGGQRKKGAVNRRSLITLDIDYATDDVWDEIQINFDFACCIYSTHSHTNMKPRLRWVIPLSRDVDRDEYEALARGIAGVIGMDLFDDSTYQPERLMFWPSTPSNGEYIFEQQDGDALDVDTELAGLYDDWHDSSQWPISSRQAELVRTGMKTCGDPLEKPGAIGRFCRTYTVQEAIDEYLGDEYIPTANDPNRYTYAKGTTAGGLVIYDDKFAYSHHGTDPTGGMLCNAFDLVRIHLFGDLDKDKEGTEVTKRPSYQRMESLVGKDKNVLRLDGEETRERLLADFGDLRDDDPDEPDEPDGKDDNTSWTEELDRDKNGGVKSTIDNVLLVMENAPGLKDNLKRNEMARVDVISGNLPWRRIAGNRGMYWSNDDDAQLLVWMEKMFGITGKEKILNAKTDVACRHGFHPVRQYLKATRWDGVERLEAVFVDYLGALDSPLTRAVTRKSLTAAVARVMKPGCKYDYITVLQGPEGIGKSTLLKKLGGEWFNDSITDLSGKDGMEQIQGCWIVEAAELQGVKRNEVEEVKAFVSRQEDVFRPAYGRTKERCPRQCVFFSTTNETEFLRGNTGNRRFWIVQCGEQMPRLDVWTLSEEIRGQIWAEALLTYEKGEKLYLERDLEKKMREWQADYNEMINDPRLGMIEEYLNKKLPVNWGEYDATNRRVYLADADAQEQKGVNEHDKTCAAEILQECFNIRIDESAKYKVKEINAIMGKMPGWEKTKSGIRFTLYGYQRGYKRIKFNKNNEEDDL